MSTVSKDITPIPHNESDSYVSFEDFIRLYSNMEDGFKYEWNNGKIEKTAGMNQTQFYIIKILTVLFSKTKISKNGGLLIQEGDMMTSKYQLRKPDLAIYSNSQIENTIHGENQIASWVGEIISPSDNINRVNKKIHEYFAAGVKVVWHIFPELDEVYVYTAPDEVTICRGNRVCSAKPALDNFEISAAEIFVYKKYLKKKA